MNQRGIEEILENYDSIERVANNWVKKPNVSDKEVERGFTVSKQSTAHPTEVPMTPIMKTMLRTFGDIAEGERLPTGAPLTRAEKWLDSVVQAILLQQSSKKTDSYDTNLPICDISHYWTQCWINWNMDKFRDVGEGQVEEINDVIDIYAKPTKAIDLRSKMRKDLLFCKAVEVVSESIPTVSATRKIVEINLPFMTKHTNVGYVPGVEGFGNDRSMVRGTNLTYAQYTMKIAESIKSPDQLYKYNVTEEFARYQRQKGRLILAVSRIINLYLNQLESIEIQNYKLKSSLFAGYNNATFLKSVLKDMADFASRNGYVTYNIDYHRFDQHICKQLIILIGAISMYKCADKRSKDIALYRAALMTKTWVIAGTKGDTAELIEIFGRIFSGFIDTNRGGGLIDALSMIYCLMKQDPHYVRDIYSRCRYPMLVMGDDNLLVAKRDSFNLKRLQTDAEKELGHEIDDATKIAYGVTFLQYRLINYNDMHIMVYAWTRVLRSALMKERPAHLGPCGWTLAWWQQIAKCIDFEHPDVLEFAKPVVNILAYFDVNHLMIDRPLDEIFKGIEQEDIEAMSQNKRAVTTAEAMYDGDPSKAEQFEERDGKIYFKPNYFAQVQQVIKAAYDPDYFKKLSIGTPKLK